jgi:hypothetical protein
MARKPKKEAAYSDLPVLTELSETSAHIPVLLEEPAERPSPPPPGKGLTLTEAQYQELVTRLASQLETMLSEKFSRYLEAFWLESWQEVEKKLPEMIHAQLAALKQKSSK